MSRSFLLRSHPIAFAATKRSSTLAKASRGLFPFILAAVVVIFLAAVQTQAAYSFFQSPEATPTPGGNPAETPTPEAPAPAAPEGAPQVSSPEATSAMVVNEVKLIDTIVQWIAWLWLCVGVGVILLVPIFFLFLQLRGSRLNRWK